jgi:hypothetical protein
MFSLFRRILLVLSVAGAVAGVLRLKGNTKVTTKQDLDSELERLAMFMDKEVDATCEKSEVEHDPAGLIPVPKVDVQVLTGRPSAR